MRRLFAMVGSTYFFSELGRSMYFILITWALYQQTKDASYTGLLVGLGFLFFSFQLQLISPWMIIVLLTYILAALSLFLLLNSMHHNITQHSARQSSFIEHFTDGVRYLRRHSILHQLLSMMFIGQLVFHTSIAFLRYTSYHKKSKQMGCTNFRHHS